MMNQKSEEKTETVNENKTLVKSYEEKQKKKQNMYILEKIV